MSESDIDMDRCLLGIDDEKAYVPEITWNNCADKMPPEIYKKIIVSNISANNLFAIESCFLRQTCLDFNDAHNFKWTEFTKEKWEKLKND